MLFLSQALAQTKRPESFCRYSREMKFRDDGSFFYETEDRTARVLPYHRFPWGVCFKNPYFDKVKGASNISLSERKWTLDAMLIWNTKYENYKYNRWGSYDVMNIPAGPLFVWSCNRDQYNIIYTVKNDLGTDKKDTLGRYWSVDNYSSFEDLWRYFYAVIEMDNEHFKASGKPRVWTKAHFVNVMMHELGHAMGLQHEEGGDSEIMPSHGFGGQCKANPEETLCTLKDHDIEKFLWPYKPAGAETRVNYEARMERKRYMESAEYRCRQPQTGPIRILCP